VNQVLDLLVPHFHDEVQTILGNAEVTVNDLLLLPRQPKKFRHGWLVYIDILLALSIFTAISKPQQSSKSQRWGSTRDQLQEWEAAFKDGDSETGLFPPFSQRANLPKRAIIIGLARCRAAL